MSVHGVCAYVSAWIESRELRSFKQHVAACVSIFGLEILAFCRSRADGSSGVVRVLKL